ncbi:glycoside hydrolase family 15 protein [Krasilnikovia sp. M28-CT-15]|uniref:glycoside hydrolase family 15 protein n=1 Tax=Krasilnikovia sp. M28-CT-15 TaxID=3373540 RepID=UPI0038771FE0
MNDTRPAGWAPIGDYGVVGDGRTVALIAADGRIDWLPLPDLDAPPVFAALLDRTAGGCLELRPSEAFTVHRRYVDDTNVLETTFTTATGSVRLTDALAVGPTGPLPWTELIRRVEGITGEVDLRWAVRPGSRFDTAEPWVELRRDVPLVHCGDQHMALLCFGIGDPVMDPHAVTGHVRVGPGRQAVLALVSSDSAPVYLPDRDQVLDHLDATLRFWRDWSRRVSYDGRWSAAVRRSALALKLLQYRPTGALAAAATTSLPERIGGARNWDYRYMWVRDAAYTVDAMLRLHLHEDVHAAVTFLLRCTARTAPDLRVFYTVRGAAPEAQQSLNADGYRRSRPVRSGNAAATQTQLGTFGDLFDSVWRYVSAGHVLDPATGRMLADLADRCCDLWRTEDSGLWELNTHRHYTVSKMGCWVALDRAVRLYDAGDIPVRHPQRWRAERDAIRAWVNEHCWSPRKRSYSFFAGTDDLDAATLLAGQTGFDTGERLSGTVAAVRRELAEGPLIYRYTGMRTAEGAFLACSFWLASALVVLGRRAEAIAQMDATVALVGDLGLLAEEMDPRDQSMLGNIPQALSHLALINAAHAVQRCGESPRTSG